MSQTKLIFSLPDLQVTPRESAVLHNHKKLTITQKWQAINWPIGSLHFYCGGARESRANLNIKNHSITKNHNETGYQRKMENMSSEKYESIIEILENKTENLEQVITSEIDAWIPN